MEYSYYHPTIARGRRGEYNQSGDPAFSRGRERYRQKHFIDSQTHHADSQHKRPRMDRTWQDRDVKNQLEQEWRRVTKKRFPNMSSKIYFVPPVYFNRLTTEDRTIDGEKLQVQIPTERLSDIRENESQNRMHFTLRRVLEGREKGLTVVWGLDYDTYLNNLTSTEDPQQSSSGQGDGGTQTGSERQSKSATGKKVPPKHVHGGLNFGFRRPRDLEAKFQRGTFDVLIISKQHGLIVGEIKATGDAFQLSEGGMSRTEMHRIINDKLKKAVRQLVKARHVLKYLVSDLDASVPVQTTLMLPNMKRGDILDVLRQDPALKKEFCKSLGRDGDLPAALKCCILCDQLPPMGKPWEIRENDKEQLYTSWWCSFVDSSGEPKLSDNLFESLVARFCGPATPLHVSTTRNPRAEVSTLHDAVVETGRCLKNWVLSTKQVELQASKDPLVYLTGPQGTGKTVMLMLRALKWARAGRRVIFASIWHGSHAVTVSIYKQVLGRLSDNLKGRVKLLVCNKSDPDDIMKELAKAMLDDTDDTQTIGTQGMSASEDRLLGGQQEVAMDTDVQDSEQKVHVPDVHPGARGNSVRQEPLSDYSPGQAEVTSSSVEQHQVPGARKKMTSGRPKQSVHMIFDEAPWFFPDIIEQLLDAKDQFAEFQCWAAAPFHGSKPPSFKEVQLKNTLRCPHVVIRELERGAAHSTRAIYQYSNLDAGILSSLPPLTDGPPVKRISHLEHTAHDVWHCEECGLEVGRFLNEELQIGQHGDPTERDVLKWGEVTISGYVDLSADGRSTAFLEGLNQQNIPYKTITRDNPEESAKALACPDPSYAQIADVESILGLKRTVVVVIGTHDIGATYPRYVDPWCDVISRCNSQLVVVGDMHIVNRIGNVFPKLVQIG